MNHFTKWVEISKKAVIHNLNLFRSIVGSGVRVVPVVKANAYGHGILEFSSILYKNGVKFFGVNELDEALFLTKNFPDTEVLILGYVPFDRFFEVVKGGYHLTVYNKKALKFLSELGKKFKKKVFVHLKVETGNNRQGILFEDIEYFVNFIKKSEFLHLAGVSTHFADIEDTTDHFFADLQLERFKKSLELIKKLGVFPDYIHCANSAATILWKKTHFNMVRVGIAMYGMWPSQETYITALEQNSGNIVLKPVLTWKTRIAQIKRVKKGEYIGYGRTFRATHDMRIAVLPVGYYDGYDRRLSNISYVIINGERAPIRGRVCMNMIMVDVTHINNIDVETPVILLGREKDEKITAEDLASMVGTINYEITTRIAAHVPRIIVD